MITIYQSHEIDAFIDKFEKRRSQTSADVGLVVQKIIDHIRESGDRALVEYALAGMDNKLFVSKYKLELPSKKDMERFIEEQIKGATD